MGPKKNYDGEFDNDWTEKETGFDKNDSCDSSDLPYIPYDTLDKLTETMYNQLGIHTDKLEPASATKIADEAKVMDDYDVYRMNLLAHAIIELNEKAGYVIDPELEERIRIAFKHIFDEKEEEK